jgi:hypothetical protein
MPPACETPLCRVTATLCCVVALVKGLQSKRNVVLLKHSAEEDGPRDLNYLRITIIKELGDEAAMASSRVFESIMLSREGLYFLRQDMDLF